MPKFRVLMSRTRTVKEYAVVFVTSSSATYAERDAKGSASVCIWSQENEAVSPIEFDNIKEIAS